MPKYHVDTKENLELLQVTIDQELGLRDASGNVTPAHTRQQMVHIPGRGLVPAFSIGAFNCVDQPGTHYPITEGDDGTAAIMIPDDVPKVSACLGKRIREVNVPRSVDLVAVDGPRDHDKLPTGVMKKMDDEYLKRFEVTVPDKNNPLLTESKLPFDVNDVDNPSAKLSVDERLTLVEAINTLGPTRLKESIQRNVDDKVQSRLELAMGLGEGRKG